MSLDVNDGDRMQEEEVADDNDEVDNLNGMRELQARQQTCRFLALDVVGVTICTNYYEKYLMKQETRTSTLSGWQWVQETLTTPGESYRMFRMEPHVITTLTKLLENHYGLRSSRDMLALEAVAMFAWTCAHKVTNRNVQNRFKHSGETVSRKFEEVLDSLVLLSTDIVKAPDLQFRNIPKRIRDDKRYWPHFQGCIGAIDGTHIPAVVPVNDIVPYIGRKGYPTQNVLAVCNFNMLFTFVVAGWPGSAHDTRILTTTLEECKEVFPHPPEGKFYVVDAGYPNMKGYLAPYKGERYHIPDFRSGSQPSGYQEVFNHAHSSIRNVIERTFGVWKNRWQILFNMPSYPLIKQKKLVAATMALHNYIRRHAIEDEEFNKCDQDPNYIPSEEEGNSSSGRSNEVIDYNGSLDDSDMGQIRDQIAASLMQNR